MGSAAAGARGMMAACGTSQAWPWVGCELEREAAWAQTATRVLEATPESNTTPLTPLTPLTPTLLPGGRCEGGYTATIPGADRAELAAVGVARGDASRGMTVLTRIITAGLSSDNLCVDIMHP